MLSPFRRQLACPSQPCCYRPHVFPAPLCQLDECCPATVGVSQADHCSSNSAQERAGPGSWAEVTAGRSSRGNFKPGGSSSYPSVVFPMRCWSPKTLYPHICLRQTKGLQRSKYLELGKGRWSCLEQVGGNKEGVEEEEIRGVFDPINMYMYQTHIHTYQNINTCPTFNLSLYPQLGLWPM